MYSPHEGTRHHAGLRHPHPNNCPVLGNWTKGATLASGSLVRWPRRVISGAYLQEIRKFPMLDADEEFMLAKRWREHDDTEAAHSW